MGAPEWIAIGIRGVLFLAWAAVMFRWLFGLRRRAVAMSGQQWPGLRAQVGALRGWWCDPAATAERRWLLALTLAQFAAIAFAAARGADA